MLVCPAEIRTVTLEGCMETERLLIDPIRESDKADYFRNISNDKKVLETFI